MDFLKKTDNGYQFTDKDNAQFVLVPIKEYHGYENALRILREKSLLNAEKSKADEHGYTLKLASESIRKDFGISAWKISAETPYSLKIGLENAAFLIEKDLRAYYGMPDPDELPEDRVSFYKKRAKMFTPQRDVSWEVIYNNLSWAENSLVNDPFVNKEQRQMEIDECRTLINLHEKYQDRIILGIESISANYGNGRFQVTYIATKLAELQ